jgi:hypothetical protein
MDEIVGLDGVEFRPAPLAAQKVPLKCGRPGRREPSQRVILQVLAGLVVVDMSLRAHHNLKIGNQQREL